MVGNYKRISNRQSWDSESMQKAIDAVNNKQMGWQRASKMFGVPQATLRRRVQGKNKQIVGVDKGLGRFQQTLPTELETELVQHIKDLESRLFGLTLNDVRKLAFELAKRNEIGNRFSKQTLMAGKAWLHGFRKRNPSLSLRQPEPTSAARARGFNKPQVKAFFDKLDEVVQTNHIQPTKIWNADESALSTVQRPPKILAARGKKQVGAITSAERGQHATVMCCMSSSGNFIPPALIFARKKTKDELFDSAPIGTLGLVNESGWMTGDLFLRWLKHFKEYANPTSENKVLLLVDGHSTHKYLDALIYAKENHIIMLSLPPHCTHYLQPLDVTFFGPLKTYYNQEVSNWLRNHPGRVVGQFQVASLFSAAYGIAATIHNATSGFAKTGIWPFNPNIFPDHLFCPSAVTERSLSEKENTENETAKTKAKQQAENCAVVAVPQVSSATSHSDTPTSSGSGPSFIRPVDISPLPSGPEARPVSNKRKLESSQVLTSSPYVSEVKAKVVKKRMLECRRAAKQAKKKLCFDKPTGDEEDRNLSNDDDDDDDDVPCLYCNDLFSHSKPKETWLKCVKCSLWAHSECAGVSQRTKMFTCDVCK